MSEDQELSRLEKQWKNRFERYTSPEPTTEQTFRLLARIKETEETKPADLRAELEAAQSAQSAASKLAGLFLAQWNFYGMRSWLLTGVVMLLLTVMINGGTGNEMSGLLAWMKGGSLVMIAVMGYAFRSRNKGNDIIEVLSYYSLTNQMFARFIIVMALQVAITLPLSFLILGGESSVSHVLGSFMPIFFFGTVGFTSAMWFGHKVGVMVTLFVWLSQILLDRGSKTLSMFQLPWNEHVIGMTASMMGLAGLLLGSVLLKNNLKRDLQ